MRHAQPVVAEQKITIESVLAWLDAGQPDPDTAAARITHTITALIDAARS